MRNMKKKKQQLLKIITFGLFTTLIVSCVSDKPSSEKLSFPKVEFAISATSDTTLFGIQGTRLFIEKGSFQFTDGTPVTDSIKIELKEFYKKSEGKVLETGGMLNISATSKGQKLEIKKDKRIVVHFPKTKGGAMKMSLFYPGKGSKDSSVLNWNLDTHSLFKNTMSISKWGWKCLIPGSDCTPVDSRPLEQIDSNKYFSLLQPYVDRFYFTERLINEIKNSTNKNIEFEVDISSLGRLENPTIKTNLSEASRAEIIKLIQTIPALTPSKDKMGNAVKRRGYLSLTTCDKIPIYQTSEQYIKSFDAKYTTLEGTPIKSVDDAELEYYIFSVAKLGWINCDHFIMDSSTITYITNLKANQDTKLKMIFKEFNGVIMADEEDGKFVFSGIPIGSNVTIVGIKNTEGQLQTAFKDVTISDKPLESLIFKETTLTELKQQLEKLN